MIKYALCVFLVSLTLLAAPIMPMNKAFNALMDLVPFLSERDAFMEKKNEASIQKSIVELDDAFSVAKHESLLKQDIFAPSLALARENLKDTRQAFEKGKKDYAHWRLKELTGQCMDCHTRLPTSHASSFQEGFSHIDPRRFKSPYDLGIAQMIVRLYPEAKNTFTMLMDSKIVKGEFEDILLPLKQILLIQIKVNKDPQAMLSMINHYEKKSGFKQQDRDTMKEWTARLKVWLGRPYAKGMLANDAEVEKFIKEVMQPLFKKDIYVGKYDVDLLFASGLLSNFSFENPHSKKAPEILYWLGSTEKYLKRENFFGSGDYFLKECVRRYPKSMSAPNCLKQYKESVEFEFTGSRGTDIPGEIKKEISELEAMIKRTK